MMGVGLSGAPSQSRMHSFVSNGVGMSLGPLNVLPVSASNCKCENTSMSGTPRLLQSCVYVGIMGRGLPAHSVGCPGG